MTNSNDGIKASDYKMSGTISHLFAEMAGKKMTTEMLWTWVVDRHLRNGYSLFALARKDGTWDVYRKDVQKSTDYVDGFAGHAEFHVTDKKSTLMLRGVSEDQVKLAFGEHEKKIRELKDAKATEKKAENDRERLQSLTS